MTKALILLLRNRAVRTMIMELCVGVAVGVVTALNKKDWNEKRKRVLLYLQKGTSNGWAYRPEKEMRPENQRIETGEEGKSWNGERGSQRNYM